MKTQIYADTGDLVEIAKLSLRDDIFGITTNPSILKKSGVTDYKRFAMAALECCKGKPISFEVLADDFATMERQAFELRMLGDNVIVKIPICTTSGKSTAPVIKKLCLDGIKVNITAIMTKGQIDAARNVLSGDGHILSIFAGRIADTGVGPGQIVQHASMQLGRSYKVLWASARQVLDVRAAEQTRCDIITLSPELIDKKDAMFGKDLDDYSRETVVQFFNDSKGITL